MIRSQMDMWYLGGAVVCAVLAAAWDLLKGRIPNQLTYSGIVAGLALRAFVGGWRGMGDGLAAGLVGGGLFFLFFLVRGMGAGDVKLMAAVGCLVGLQQTLVVMLASAIAGGVLALGYAIFHRRGVSTLRNVGVLVRFHLLLGLQPHPEINLQNPQSIKVPYAVAIAVGTLYAFGMLVLRG